MNFAVHSCLQPARWGVKPSCLLLLPNMIRSEWDFQNSLTCCKVFVCYLLIQGRKCIVSEKSWYLSSTGLKEQNGNRLMYWLRISLWFSKWHVLLINTGELSLHCINWTCAQTLLFLHHLMFTDHDDLSEALWLEVFCVRFGGLGFFQFLSIYILFVLLWHWHCVLL